MTRLDRLDGPATVAIGDRLVDIYRAAMGAAPFHETEVEAGFFADELAGELDEPGFRCWVASEADQMAGFAYGYETPEVPSEGWCGLLREAVGQGPDGAGRWLEGQFAVVWIAVRPDRRGQGLGRRLLERLLEGGHDRTGLAGHPRPRHPGPRPLPLPRVPGAGSRPARLARRGTGRARRRAPAGRDLGTAGRGDVGQ